MRIIQFQRNINSSGIDINTSECGDMVYMAPYIPITTSKNFWMSGPTIIIIIIIHGGLQTGAYVCQWQKLSYYYLFFYYYKTSCNTSVVGARSAQLWCINYPSVKPPRSRYDVLTIRACTREV